MTRITPSSRMTDWYKKSLTMPHTILRTIANAKNHGQIEGAVEYKDE